MREHEVHQFVVGPLGVGELQDFMLAHPILINRPIVVTPLGVKLCRPSEGVLEILASPTLTPFTKENGEVVIDTGVRRD